MVSVRPEQFTLLKSLQFPFAQTPIPQSWKLEGKNFLLSLGLLSGSSFVLFLGKTTPHKANFKFLLGGFFQVVTHPSPAV